MTAGEALLLDIPEEIETRRLVLRCPRAGNGPLTLASVRESLAELKPWMPWATDEYGLSDAEQWCRKAAALFLLREQTQFLMIGRADGQHLGNIGAFKFNWAVASCEI